MQITREDTLKEITCRTAVYNNSYRPFHWHENIEMCQLINNPGSFLVDGTLIEANPGDIVVIGEQTVHQFLINVPDTTVRIFQMSPRALFDNDCTIKPLKNHITAEEIQSVANLSPRLEMLFDIIQNDNGSEKTGDKPYIKAVAASIYFLLMNYFPGEADTRSHKERQFFYKATDYVNHHFAEDISVQSVAEALYVSRGKLGSVFSKYAGMPLSQYLNSLRVKNANKLIESGCTITQAALDSGFQNVRTFNEVYKKIFGKTPSEYLSAK